MISYRTRREGLGEKGWERRAGREGLGDKGWETRAGNSIAGLLRSVLNRTCLAEKWDGSGNLTETECDHDFNHAKRFGLVD
jgi:hypothetical protein